ncbi:MAG: histone deacetylase [Gemmatimonadetes bacterium]|nr:histone deacetylase [Gemmatimonadota bacterium]
MAPSVIWSPKYEVDLGPHVFVTAKYRLARERLLADRTLAEVDFTPAIPATRDELAGVHTNEFLSKVETDSLSFGERAQLEVPLTEELREAMALSCGGTLLTARTALEDGVAVHLGGGFHHAYAGHGEGFCLYNDIAVAARALRSEGAVERVAVVDLDVHHGNGTAAIFVDDDEVFTFSMHQQSNYPSLKPPSDLDIALEDGTADGEYLELLEGALPEVLDQPQPELILYLAGADPYEHDQLGGLSMTLEGLRRRDRMLLEAAAERSIPVAVVMAGGYAHRLEDTVSIHVATVEEAVGVG